MTIKKTIHFLKKGFWVLYFLFLLYSQAALILEYHGLTEIVDLLISLPALAGLYSFIAKRSIMPVQIWRIYFFVFLTWHIYRNVVLEVVNQTLAMLPFIPTPLDVLKYMLIFFPLYFALYKISFSNHFRPIENE